MSDRRNFLKRVTIGSAALMNPAIILRGANLPTNYYSVHPFVLTNPDAVFIMRTNIASKTDSEAKKQAGLDFGRSVFREREMGKYLIPRDIPLYQWSSDGTAMHKNLTDFTQTPLLTCYLQKNYGGSNEP